MQAAAMAPFWLMLPGLCPARLRKDGCSWPVTSGSSGPTATKRKSAKPSKTFFLRLKTPATIEWSSSPTFFTPDVRIRTIALAQTCGIDVPIIYHGGTLHESAAADQTIAEGLDYANVAKALGVKMLNTNANPKAGGAAKTDDELAVQAKALNTFGERLHDRGLRFEPIATLPKWRRSPRMALHADPHRPETGLDLRGRALVLPRRPEPLALLEEAGKRVASLHLRNSVNKIWSNHSPTATSTTIA